MHWGGGVGKEKGERRRGKKIVTRREGGMEIGGEIRNIGKTQ